MTETKFTLPFPARAEHVKEVFPLCGKAVVRDEDAEIRRIVTIGALYDANSGFSNQDKIWLRRTKGFCEKFGIKRSAEVQITPWEYEFGHDFLASANLIEADLLVMCWVNNPECAEDARTSGDYEESRFEIVSPHHFEPEAWYNSSRKTGAKLVISFGGCVAPDAAFSYITEITSVDLNGPGFIAGPRRLFRRRSWTVQLESLFDESYAARLMERPDTSPNLLRILTKNKATAALMLT
jgi:hypothetical protein